MKTLIARRHKHMSNGASNDGADNSQYNRLEDSEMSVHDRLGDDARDQPNEVQHPDSFRCAATLMVRMRKGEKAVSETVG
jgi:hypothetical protein